MRLAFGGAVRRAPKTRVTQYGGCIAVADRYSASLRIPASFYHGDVKRRLDSYADDTGYEFYEDDADGIIYLEQDYALRGEFPDLEGWLVDQGIPFDRYSAGYYDIEPCLRQYRPAEDGCAPHDAESLLTENGDKYLLLSHVEKCLELPDDQVVAAVRRLIAKEWPSLRPLADYN